MDIKVTEPLKSRAIASSLSIPKIVGYSVQNRIRIPVFSPEFTSRPEYSGDLKSRLVWISNGPKKVGLKMFQKSGGNLAFGAAGCLFES